MLTRPARSRRPQEDTTLRAAGGRAFPSNRFGVLMCGMEALVFLLALAFLGLPIAALALALTAQARTARLMEQLERLRREVETLDRRLRAQPSAAPPGPAGMATEAVPRVVPPPPPAAPPPAEPPLPRPAQAETPHAATPGPEPLASLAQPAAAKPAEDRPGIEQRIATQLPVWIGSIALFLAGTYLVKWSFDRGLLGPAARVTIGILFGVALLVLGEWLRAGSRRIAEGLSAAGIADLYASLLAGVSLYHLISKPVGFGLLALTTATAVFLSLRHGALIAVLGLAGGFLTPALIGAREPSAAAAKRPLVASRNMPTGSESPGRRKNPIQIPAQIAPAPSVAAAIGHQRRGRDAARRPA